jgi:tRNA-Thr(GGU) m(6)t(6)A37 methyltransferase TsaA
MMVEPIGWVRSPRVDPVDDEWSDVIATISLDERFSPESLSGLAEFSHVEIVYLFNQVDPDSVETGARHPRGNEDWPAVGIFAQRGKSRPNRLGVSVCRLLGVEGRTVTVQALDAIDATPVLDIKPYMAEFAPRGLIRQPDWSNELMAGYWRAPSMAAQPGESMATRRSYDRVAERYADELSAELVGKPLDRGLLDALAQLSAPGVMVDVGCGPGHVTAHLAQRRMPVVGLDLSPVMCSVARRATGLAFGAGDMTALPLPTAGAAAIVCLYAVIHLDVRQRAEAYREFARVLRAGGHALIAFHTGDEEMATGETKELREWWNSPVDLRFRFLDPSEEAEAIRHAGFEVVARLDRSPYPASEHPSRRTYLLARRSRLLGGHGV